MPDEGTEISALPAALGGASGASPSGSPGPAMMPLGDEDELATDAGMDLAELSGMCGDIYADVFGVAAQLYVGQPLELPEERAQRRGKQLAVVLRKLGWADDEIVCYVGLTTGVASDVALLHRARLELDEQEKRRALEAEQPSGEGLGVRA